MGGGSVCVCVHLCLNTCIEHVCEDFCFRSGLHFGFGLFWFVLKRVFKKIYFVKDYLY